MKKILVTGSNGLLGQKLSLQILSLKNEFELIATAKGDNRYLNSLNYHSLDISNEEEVKAIFEKFKPDIVIHTAAVTNVDHCEIDKTSCWKINVDAVGILVKASEKINAHFIHLSTDFIFEGTKANLTEEDLPHPVSYYGESKLAAEEIVKNAKCPWAIVRTSLVYGVVHNLSRSNIVLWAKNALQKGEQIKVVNDQYRTPTLAEDLADGCIKIAQKQKTGIYNISGDEYMSVLELVKKVANFYQVNTEIIVEVSSKTLNQTARRPAITGFNLSKAKSDLSYQPHSFMEGLKIVDQQIKQS